MADSSIARENAEALDIRLGFCRSDAEKDEIFWAPPSFAPDHVDDGVLVAAANASAQLRVELIFSIGSMHTLARASGTGAAEAVRTVAEPLPGGYTTDPAEFASLVAAGGDAEKICGEEVCKLADGLRVRRTDLTSADALAFVMRLTNAMLWLIDGCTPIEVGPDGARWHLVTVWRDGELVAASTTFTFVVPVRRLRVCQFLVLPQHQRRGIGAQLLEAIVDMAKRDGAVELNVEDPCPGFRALRDFVDARRATTLRAQIEALAGSAPTAEQLAAAQKELLLSKDQAQRLVEILRLRALDAAAAAPAAADAMTSFRVGCKKRLLKLHDEDLGHLAVDERKRKLAELYDEAADAYRRCARKL